ncbi:hypothetical protein FHX80_11758 [Streptomyces brevispora]|uniref:Uncharacterized protein n=1 Tax=Streptomyces brevispora TaxID=887462 RepID=A0A561USJ9_9ACTN|nr:hypothetical protein FHX80_11758 [Streptomyces brevispora]
MCVRVTRACERPPARAGGRSALFVRRIPDSRLSLARETGSSDSSAAVDVGGGYAVVADDESNVPRLYDRSSSGAPVRTWDLSSKLGVSKEIDIEAAARVGNTVYWTGSLGNNKDGKYKSDRNTVFTTTVSGSGGGLVPLTQHAAVGRPALVSLAPGHGFGQIEFLAVPTLGVAVGGHVTSPRLRAFSYAVRALSRSSRVAGRTLWSFRSCRTLCFKSLRSTWAFVAR